VVQVVPAHLAVWQDVVLAPSMTSRLTPSAWIVVAAVRRKSCRVHSPFSPLDSTSVSSFPRFLSGLRSLNRICLSPTCLDTVLPSMWMLFTPS